jgi:transcriptional antiterminator NusG
MSKFFRGQYLGCVDLAAMRGPLEVPVDPAAFYGVCVWPGRELTVMKRFVQHNISAYLPMMTESKTLTKVHRGQESSMQRNVRSPMFSGVILVPEFELHIDSYRLGMIDGVLDLFRVGDCIIRFDRALMREIRATEVMSNIPLSVRKKLEFKLGEEVRVNDGPFSGFTAIIEKGLDSQGRLGVLVDIFKRMTPIEIEQGQLEKI